MKLIIIILTTLNLLSCISNTDTHNSTEYAQAIVTGGVAVAAKAIESNKNDIPDKSKVKLTLNIQVSYPVECYLSTTRYQIDLKRAQQIISTTEVKDAVKKFEIKVDSFSTDHEVELVNLNTQKVVDSQKFKPDSKNDNFNFTLKAGCQ